MYHTAKSIFQTQLDEIRAGGLFKDERQISSSQQAHIRVAGGKEVLNMCANNYLGLANHPEIISAAHDALDRWGYGMASVRFICGTQSIHRKLEEAISRFLGTDDTILYSSCFDANGGLFETLLTKDDAVISDQLNHASIIDGIRLCKANRLRYANRDMDELKLRLNESRHARMRLVVTDGVFSMDGFIANLPEVCELADRHEALVAVDDSHAVGFMGPRGRGTHEHHQVMDRVDIITGTLGKALGGASGGYTSGRKEIIDLLRQRSRPYLFSNTLAPPIVAGSLKALELLESSTAFRDRLMSNTDFFRSEMSARKFDILPGTHPIVPIMFYDAVQASDTASRLLELGVYVTAFSYPVVPMNQARIRVQVSAAHSREDLEFAIEQFTRARS